MSETIISPQLAGQRGPADHAIRDQIIEAAGDHFRRYGYAKTTVADLASAIGFSKAYIYKFFPSKQAIGEAIGIGCVTAILQAAQFEADRATTATEKLQSLFRTVTAKCLELLFEDRKLYDMVSCAVVERWSVPTIYEGGLSALLKDIIQQGRESGEFERDTPLDETCRAILSAMSPFTHPVALELNLEHVPERSPELIRLVLRSLAPEAKRRDDTRLDRALRPLPGRRA
jgi:AcrR family transcriptional regulator